MPQANVAVPAGACIPKQSFLTEHFGKNTPLNRDTGDYGVLQALRSPANTAGVTDLTSEMVGSNMKRQTVRLLFKRATCYTICQINFNCATDPVQLKPQLAIEDYSIDKRYTLCDGAGVEQALTFDTIEYQRYCQIDDGKLLQEQIADADMGLFKRLNDVFASLINTYVPLTQALDTKMTVFNATSNSTLINPNLKFYIDQLRRNAGVADIEYMILGGSKVKQLESILGIQSASTEGFDLSKQGSLGPMYYSKSWDAISPEAIYIIPVSTFQLVTWCEFKGFQKAITELHIDNTKLFPIGNGMSIEFDYRSMYDPKCKVREYTPSIHAELLATLPGGCNITNPTLLPIWKLTDCTAIPTLVC
jgi:hypothetical protein